MSTYRQRKGLVIFKQTASSNLQVGASYKVNVRPPGAVVSGTSSGDTSIPVYAGHGFQANDKLMIYGQATTTFRTVSSLTGTTQLNVSANLDVAAGDILINLGTDTGSTSPDWTESSIRAEIYNVPDNGSPVAGSLQTANSEGEYSYWRPNSAVWEIIRDTTGAVQDLIMGAGERWIEGPSTTVDNGLLRWDGTDGSTVQAFTSGTPTVGDTGAAVFASTLSTAGLATLASAAVTAGATVGTTLSVSGDTSLEDVTASGTLAVTSGVTLNGTLSAGASTLASAIVTGNASVGGNLTVTGSVDGGAASVSITGNDAITTADRFLINLTNTSGTNTITLVAPSSVDGKLLLLRCQALTAGTFSLANGGNVDLVSTTAWTPTANQTLTLVANGVIWYELCRSAN